MKMILECLDYLEEVAMNATQLLEPNEQTQQLRTEILLNRIKLGQPIELSNGKQVVIDPLKSRTAMNVLQTGNANVIKQAFAGGKKSRAQFVTKDGEMFPLIALKKADYFKG